jgi:DNA-binding transcriptional MerR regulator
MKKLMAITEVAKMSGISPSTIKKWEELEKAKKAKRDQRGWRVYDQYDAENFYSKLGGKKNCLLCG